MPNYTIVITSSGSAQAWSLLRAGVPLSLICDLAEPDGPRSREIYTAEVVADDVAIDLTSLGADRPADVIELPEAPVKTA